MRLPFFLRKYQGEILHFYLGRAARSPIGPRAVCEMRV